VALVSFLALAAPGEAALTLNGLAIDDPPTADVVERPTLTRRLDPIVFVGTLRTAEWLLDRPDLAATLARNLHPPLERYRVASRDDGSFDVDDRGSLHGHFRLVARGFDRRAYFCQGQIRSLAHLLMLSGRLVFTLEYRERRQGGVPAVEMIPDLYLRLDNSLAHGILKTIAPLLHAVIDRRVANLTAATRMVGERIARDPEGLFREMQTWRDVRQEDLEAYRRAFLPEREAR
jgi:hypothetical protein